MQHISKILMIAGGMLFLLGLLFFLTGDKWGWIGKLPGDFKIERENFSFYFPFTTMILLSILISIIWRIIARFL